MVMQMGNMSGFQVNGAWNCFIPMLFHWYGEYIVIHMGNMCEINGDMQELYRNYTGNELEKGHSYW